MQPAEWARDGAAVWDIAAWDGAAPGRAAAGGARPPGLRMAGFSGRTTDVVDLPVVPYPAVTVFVDLGDGLLVDDESGATQRGGVVAGLAPRGARGRGRHIECLQIRLSPTLACAVFGTGLGRDVVALDDIWPTTLPERLREAESWAERFALAEAALARRYEAGRRVDDEVAFVWRRMAARRGRVRVEHLADETGWSRKRLWSRFRAQIGLAPKRAAQLVRFDEAAHRLAAGASPASVAAAGGYADQSHLHRDVAAFAGVTPATVANAPWLAVDDIAWPR